MNENFLKKLCPMLGERCRGSQCVAFIDLSHMKRYQCKAFAIFYDFQSLESTIIKEELKE